MKKINPSTTLAVGLNIGSVICLSLGFLLPASVLSMAAYFASIKEVSKYTGWYQFITVFVSVFLIGTSLYIPFNHFPFLTIALVLAVFGYILRIVFFTTFWAPTILYMFFVIKSYLNLKGINNQLPQQWILNLKPLQIPCLL